MTITFMFNKSIKLFDLEVFEFQTAKNLSLIFNSICLKVKVKSLSWAYSLRLHGPKPTRLLCPWDFPSKNTGVGCHFLLQEIFPTQELNVGLPHFRQTLYHLSHHTFISVFVVFGLKKIYIYIYDRIYLYLKLKFFIGG